MANRVSRRDNTVSDCISLVLGHELEEEDLVYEPLIFIEFLQLNFFDLLSKGLAVHHPNLAIFNGFDRGASRDIVEEGDFTKILVFLFDSDDLLILNYFSFSLLDIVKSVSLIYGLHLLNHLAKIRLLRPSVCKIPSS